MRERLWRFVLAGFLAGPLLSGSIYSKVSWGMTTKDVQNHYPKSHSVTLDTDEVFIRVKTSPLSKRQALTTFAVRPGLGLTNIVTEFPAFGMPASFEDYPRPNSEEAQVIKKTLTALLTQKFGKPSFEKNEAHGSITVWGNKEEVARILMSVLESGKADIRLDLSKKLPGISGTEHQERLLGVYNRTQSFTWTTGGGIKARFGMGVGDVKDIYPSLKAGVLSSSYEPVKKYRVTAFIEGSVDLEFQFYKGRLVRIEVSPASPYGSLRMSDKEREDWWDECDYWGDRALKILKEKYGAPISMPDPAKWQASKSSQLTGETLRWAWLSEGTGIEFLRRTSALQFITYQDLSTNGREAFLADRDYEEAQEDARKAPF